MRVQSSMRPARLSVKSTKKRPGRKSVDQVIERES
jgi:hypothetical protein